MLLCSCEPPFGRSRFIEIRLAIPETPASWSEIWGPARFHVTWWSFGANGSHAVALESAEEISLMIPRGEVVAICAWPRWPSPPNETSSDQLRPAGAVVSPPRQLRRAYDPAIPLSFEDGPLALVLSRAAAAGADIRAFNWERLGAAIQSEVGQDLWLLDTERLIRAICERSMRITYVRNRELKHVEVDIPDGRWISSSPFAPPVRGGRQQMSLPVGVSVFYSARGRLLISVDDRGRSWVGFISPRG